MYGQKEFHNKEWLSGSEGKNILISSKGEDNGVYGFFDIKTKFNAPIITVQGYGTIGQAFVQEYDCSVDDHMLILIPKQEMKIEELYSIAYQIRFTKWKYRYGRGITPDRLRNEKIKVVRSRINYKNLTQKLLPKIKTKKTIKNHKNIKLIPLTDLCEIKREYYDYIEQLDKSKEIVPYITTTEYDNGVGAFCNESPIFKSGTLTVSLDGQSASTFFQLSDFIAGEKTAVLIPKENINNSTLLYIGTIIRSVQWKYNYYMKLSVGRLSKMYIPMPMKNKSEYDLDYISSFVKNSYGYEEIKQYL